MQVYQNDIYNPQQDITFKCGYLTLVVHMVTLSVEEAQFGPFQT